MKNEVLDLISAKKVIFNKELAESVAKLEEMKTKIKLNPGKEGIHLTVNDLPLIKTRLISNKVALQLLKELETEVIGIKE